MAGLTKQHFKEIAGIINELEKSLNQNKCTCIFAIEKLSNYFRTQNPLFNENRFKKACLE